MSFEDKCPHCEHYREKVGKCCFCKKVNLPEVKTKSREEHMAELGDLDEDS